MHWTRNMLTACIPNANIALHCSSIWNCACSTFRAINTKNIFVPVFFCWLPSLVSVLLLWRSDLNSVNVNEIIVDADMFTILREVLLDSFQLKKKMKWMMKLHYVNGLYHLLCKHFINSNDLKHLHFVREKTKTAIHCPNFLFAFSLEFVAFFRI